MLRLKWYASINATTKRELGSESNWCTSRDGYVTRFTTFLSTSVQATYDAPYRALSQLSELSILRLEQT